MMDMFTNNLPQVPRGIYQICENTITNDEFIKTLKSTKNNSSPGSDGLPYEFYNHFWYSIGQTFTELANKSFEENCDLCESQRLSLIRLICKNDNKFIEL